MARTQKNRFGPECVSGRAKRLCFIGASLGRLWVPALCVLVIERDGPGCLWL